MSTLLPDHDMDAIVTTCSLINLVAMHIPAVSISEGAV